MDGVKKNSTGVVLQAFEGGGNSAIDDMNELLKAVKLAVYNYSGRMPIATALGVLEIAKAEILESSMEDLP